jgi:Xaa-Pro aminopeptidase
MPGTRIPIDRYEERLGSAQEAMGRAGVGALLIGVGTDLRWLTGYLAHDSERLTMLVVTSAGRPTLIAPRLEQGTALEAPAVGAGLVDLATWMETEDPFGSVVRALGSHDVPAARLLVSESLRASFLLRLQAALPKARFDIASAITSPLRQVKDAEEIQLLREAAHAADRTVAGIFSGRLVGRSEADVAREVRERLVDEGHEMADFWIVASGPNSASPHHEPADRVIRAGEPIVLDIGGQIGGYHSDITRTCWVSGGSEDGDGSATGPDDEFLALYGVLQRAQEAGRAAVQPDVRCEHIDAAARQIIDAAGYGEQFFHRTGHGIGLDGHEDPYLVAGNGAPLTVGNAFSVEPGIYLEGRYGARIEDIVVCGQDGPDDLNQQSRDLAVVSGLI